MSVAEKKKALAEFFHPDDVKWLPKTVKGDKAQAIAYLTARAIEDRLDDVLGPDNWQDDYEVLPEGSVICRLRVRFEPTERPNDWVVKTDVGNPSAQPDAGDRLKAAFSGGLKRAAIKLGIGRYLYKLPMSWVPYDTQKKYFSDKPKLPSWALPKGVQETPQPQSRPQPPSNPAVESPKQDASKSELPKTGQELRQRLAAMDKRLAEERRIQTGGLLNHVTSHGFGKRWDNNVDNWNAEQISEAVNVAKDWINKLPKPQ